MHEKIIKIDEDHQVYYLQMVRIVREKDRLYISTDSHAPGEYDTLIFEDEEEAKEGYRKLIGG